MTKSCFKSLLGSLRGRHSLVREPDDPPKRSTPIPFTKSWYFTVTSVSPKLGERATRLHSQEQANPSKLGINVHLQTFEGREELTGYFPLNVIFALAYP